MSQPQPLRSLDQLLVDLAGLRDRAELGRWLVGALADRPDVLWAALWRRGETGWSPWERDGTAVVTPDLDRNGLPLGAHAITEGDDAGKTYWHNDLSAQALGWGRLPGVRGIAFQPIYSPAQAGRIDTVLIVLASVAFVGEGVAWLKTLASHMTRAMERAAFVERVRTPAQSAAEDGFLTETEMRDLERRNLQAALAATSGKIYGEDGAAARLGLRPTTLASRLSKYGIDRGS